MDFDKVKALTDQEIDLWIERWCKENNCKRRMAHYSSDHNAMNEVLQFASEHQPNFVDAYLCQVACVVLDSKNESDVTDLGRWMMLTMPAAWKARAFVLHMSNPFVNIG